MRANEFIRKVTPQEDYHPNDTPPGPEFKPTMPAGTVKVDVSDVYDWYKLGQHISNLKGLGKHDFGKGPPSTILAFGSEEEEHEYIKALKKTGLTTTDIDPLDPNQPKSIPRQKTDPTYNVGDNKKAVDEGIFDSKPKVDWNKRARELFAKGFNEQQVAQQLIKEGCPPKQVNVYVQAGQLEENFADGKNPQDKGDSKRHGINTKASVSSLRKTAKQGGRKGQLAHWLANMKSGRAKNK